MTTDPIRYHLSQLIASTLGLGDDATAADLIYKDIEFCPQPEQGQYAFKTFQIAKRLGKNPKELSQTLSTQLSTAPSIKSAVAAGPYINTSLTSETTLPLVLSLIKAKNAVAHGTPDTVHRYLVEHSQPNTHKELHIGHARNSVLGDTLCRILRHNGHDVFAENYHGDEGAHVAKCLWYIVENKLQPAADDNKGTWLGKMYVASTTALAEAEKNNPAEFERIKGEISEALKQVEAEKGPFFELWKETRQWSLDLFHDMYRWLDVSFDNDRCESDVSAESFKVVEEYVDKGVFIKSEGAIGADLSDVDLGFCMLIKSDGRGLYATKDLALALTRFRERSPDTCIYVVDDRQAYHFKQVFATLDKMGFEEAKRCYHLAYVMVETKDGAMSSRKGNIVPILQLIDGIETKARDILAARYAEEWDTTMMNEVAGKIALSAIRYGMIKVEPESKIIFDLDSWLMLEGNTGPYLQYVYARMASLLRKAGDVAETKDWSLLTKESELQLIARLSAFNQASSVAGEKMKPNIFAAYVYDLARAFNSFYAEAPINAEPDVAIRAARLGLVSLCMTCLGSGLDLLGIPRIEKM
jgi:arginyl-tRNA synthetase